MIMHMQGEKLSQEHGKLLTEGSLNGLLRMASVPINIGITQQFLMEGPNEYAFIYWPSTFCNELTQLMNNILMNQANITYRFTNIGISIATTVSLWCA